MHTWTCSYMALYGVPWDDTQESEAVYSAIMGIQNATSTLQLSYIRVHYCWTEDGVVSLADGHWALWGRGETRRLAHTFCRRFCVSLVFLRLCVSLYLQVFSPLCFVFLPLCFEYQLMCIRGGRGREKKRVCVYSSDIAPKPGSGAGQPPAFTVPTCTSERARWS